MHHNSRAVKQGRIRHNSVLSTIFEDPTTLGLHTEKILFKQKSPALLDPKRETIDLIIVTQNGNCSIVLIEIKTGHMQITDSKKAQRQLKVARNYMLEHWREWLKQHKIEPSGKLVILCPVLVLCGNEIFIKDMCEVLPETLLGTY